MKFWSHSRIDADMDDELRKVENILRDATAEIEIPANSIVTLRAEF